MLTAAGYPDSDFFEADAAHLVIAVQGMKDGLHREDYVMLHDAKERIEVGKSLSVRCNKSQES